MAQKYLHFTDLAGAKAISDSGELWQSSYGPKGAVFAVVEGGAFVPGVQMSELGRAKVRSAVVVFETELLPDYAVEEEVMWHVPKLPIKIVKITVPGVAKKMLNNSIPIDEEMNLLEMSLHPAFNDWGDWTRMPEDFKPWTPGKDNEKYLAARSLFLETGDIEGLKDLWNSDKFSGESVMEHVAIKRIINCAIKEVLR